MPPKRSAPKKAPVKRPIPYPPRKRQAQAKPQAKAKLPPDVDIRVETEPTVPLLEGEELQAAARGILERFVGRFNGDLEAASFHVIFMTLIHLISTDMLAVKTVGAILGITDDEVRTLVAAILEEAGGDRAVVVAVLDGWRFG